MTSRNSFLTELKLQGKNRLWPIALCLLVFFLWYVLATVVVLSGYETQAHLGMISKAKLHTLKVDSARLILTGSISAILFVGGIAVTLAMQGFSYLQDRQKLDFYESQPTSRLVRFLSILTGSLLIFMVTHGLMLLLGAFVAVVMGAADASLPLLLLVYLFRTTIYFMAVYSIAALSVVLTGNMILSCLLCGYLALYEFVLRFLLINGFENTFYTTVSSYSQYVSSFAQELGLLTSPVYNYILGTGQDDANVMRVALEGLPYDIRNLVLASLVLLLTFFLYQLRPSEAAGKALVFRPVEILLKILTGGIIALVVGILSYTELWTHTDALLPTFLMMALFAVIVSAIMEIIYHFNFKALFSHPAEMLLVIAFSIGIFSFYRFDLGGFDRYLPKASSVQYASVFESYTWGSSIDEDGNSAGPEVLSQTMQLTEIEPLLEIAKEGQRETREAALSQKFASSSTDQLSITVAYTLKDGTVKSRSFNLPSNADPKKLDQIFGSDAYRKAIWPLSGYAFREDPFYKPTISYVYGDLYGGGKSTEMDRNLSKEFTEAYAKDLQLFNYTFAQKSLPIGDIQISGMQDPRDAAKGRTDVSLEELERMSSADNYYVNHYTLTYPVYPEYTNTIEFLKKHGLYADLSDFKIQTVSVTYDSSAGTSASDTSYQDVAQETIAPESAQDPTETFTLDDPKEITELLSALYPLSAGPLRTYSQMDNRFTVVAQLDPAALSENDDSGYGYLDPYSAKYSAADYAYTETELDFYVPKNQVPELLKKHFNL